MERCETRTKRPGLQDGFGTGVKERWSDAWLGALNQRGCCYRMIMELNNHMFVEEHGHPR